MSTLSYIDLEMINVLDNSYGWYIRTSSHILFLSASCAVHTRAILPYVVQYIVYTYNQSHTYNLYIINR